MSRTQIEFFKGPPSAGQVPSLVKATGLSRRIAVIQHTYRADSVDMYFDEPLWRRLLEFAIAFGQDQEVGIIGHDPATGRSWLWRALRREKQSEEVAPETFLSEWYAADDPDRDPPEYIVVRREGRLVLCIATEYWTQIGGPAPYADSYTYSIFAENDVSAEVESFVLSAPSAHGWEFIRSSPE